MRRPSSRRLQLTVSPKVAAVTLLGAIVVTLVSVMGVPRFGLETGSPLSSAPTEPAVEVLVVRRPIAPGSYLDQGTVSFEPRPASQVPSDAVRGWERLKGKVALSTLSTGTVVSDGQLGELIALLPSQFEPTEVPPEVSFEALMISPRDADIEKRASITHETQQTPEEKGRSQR